MSVITARGIDSSEAMDEVIRRLGLNAYILSTTVRDGMVEIRASAELPKPPAPEAGPDLPTFSSRRSGRPDLAAGADAAAPAAPSPGTPTFADLLEARSDWAPAPPLRPAVPPKTTPWARVTPEARFAALLERFEAGVLLGSALPVGKLMPRTVIIGPPGSGKSLLAVRLAAAAILANRSLSPRIIAPRKESLLSDDRLRGWSRLIGVVPERPLIGDLLMADDDAGPEPDRPHIIDMSDLADARVDLVEKLCLTMPTELILTLPSGLSPRRIARLCAPWVRLAPRIALTGVDLCAPDQATLRALESSGVRLARACQGIGVIDALCTPGRAELARWLQEEADEDDKVQSEASL